MRQDAGKRMGLALLSVAVAVRLLASTGVDAVAAEAMRGEFDIPRLVSATAAILTGQPPKSDQAPEPNVWVVRILPSQTDEPVVPEPPVFSAAEADAIGIAGGSTYPVNKSALLTAPLSFSVSDEGPQVLILHTHTSEAYTQTAGWTYEESDPFRTTQSDHSVLRVGKELAYALENRGISVVHDGSCHDYPDYNGAYARSLERTQALLRQYPTIQVVLDIHRDAVVDEDGLPLRLTTNLPDGQTAAQVMLVVGTNQGGLSHPDWEKNLSFAMKIQALAGRNCPDLFRDLNLRTERFNQHLTPASLLVEVGTAGNTLPEALAAIPVLADAIAGVLSTV